MSRRRSSGGGISETGNGKRKVNRGLPRAAPPQPKILTADNADYSDGECEEVFWLTVLPFLIRAIRVIRG